jgi:hypothetical protein
MIRSLAMMRVIWSTISEVDLDAIRSESEQPVAIASFGDAGLLSRLTQHLYTDLYTARRALPDHEPAYGPEGNSPFAFYELPITRSDFDPQQADLLLLAIDCRRPLAAAITRAIDEVIDTSLPFVLVFFYSDLMDEQDKQLFELLPGQHIVTLADPDSLPATEQLNRAVLERLPTELHLAAARALPGLRPLLAEQIIGNAAFSNSVYGFFSSIAELLPLLNVTVGAADTLVMTKNQVLLAYRLGLAYGAPGDIERYLPQLLSIIGGALVWRQLARELASQLPGALDVLPKTSISYLGTYLIGLAAQHWFATGEILPMNELKQLAQSVLGQADSRTDQATRLTG